MGSWLGLTRLILQCRSIKIPLESWQVGKLNFPVEYLVLPAEELPFPDHSFDAAVATMVLCSVKDSTQVLTEVARVVKPGGVVRFVDHVRAPYEPVGRLQDALAPLWYRWFDGCNLNRRTPEMLRESPCC
ncbi:MAG: class I SAM-dependent methyltransferase [Chloroflexi bacterium]|nr:class I SAM-dependent methyltransferase [Chloroflexota bacterium]